MAFLTGGSREPPVNNAIICELAKEIQASVGKWAATGNPDLQAIGSWARQV